jgi:CheY-like chemotaxis protein
MSASASESSRPWAPVAASPRPDALCVLVVDDNPANLMVAAEMLSLWGIKTLLAADGAEAVALACELRPALILMDLQMPVLDGLAATRQIRCFEREQSLARVPVVAYTSGSWRGPFLQDFGFDGLLDKPCDATTLHACLSRWCPPLNGAPGFARGVAARSH